MRPIALRPMPGRDWDVGRFDRWSGRYDRSVFQPVFFDRVHRELERSLSPAAGERILDVGCGTGKLAERLATAAHCRVIGVDAAPGMMRESAVRSRAGRVSFAAADAESLPFADDAFDAVVSAVSAHHWTDAADGFTELARVVRPGGRVVVADVGSLGPVIETMRRLRAIDPHHHRGWSLGDLGGLLYKAGFHAVRARTMRAMGASVVLVAAMR